LQSALRNPSRAAEAAPERVLGRHGSAGGPVLVITAGIHGNEPAGVAAVRRVMSVLETSGLKLRGECFALAGNRTGLARGVRYVDADLNRLWTDEQRAAALVRAPELDSTEQREQRELGAELTRCFATARESVTLLDLHSTSGGGPPFALMGDTLRNREVAFALGVPVLLGLEENVEGTLVGYVGSLGHVAVVLEGGQSADPRTIDHLESAVWLTLVSAGLASAAEVPDYEEHRRRLGAACAGLPAVIEVVHRHDIAAEDESSFEMLPGLSGFDAVRRGQLLAHADAAKTRAVVAPIDGVLLMPRYQKQGRDGFFMGRAVAPRKLALAALLRRARLERVIGWLPGVKLVDASGDQLEVDSRIARFFSTELLHLLGYRRHERHGSVARFTRRHDKL
jgi:succinylglutamate desuccinylase